jgi:Zn-dependent peptidase ImmA (M78 family)
LFKWFARVHTKVLPGVTDKQYLVMRSKTLDEVPHYLLHVKKNQKSQLFIDRHLTFRRDGYSSGGVDHEEAEANQFGAAPLMPRSLLQQEVKKNDLDLDYEEAITFLAKRFHVSTAAMSNRLSNLGLLR